MIDFINYNNNNNKDKMVEELSEQQLEEFHEVFDMFDTDGGGSISNSELGTVMRTLGQYPTEEEIEQMIQEVDVDGNGEIDFGEFCMLMVRKMKESEPEEELVEVFKLFDKDANGHIDWYDLDTIFKELGEKLTENDLKEMIEEHDHDGDKALSFEEFVRMMMAK